MKEAIAFLVVAVLIYVGVRIFFPHLLKPAPLSGLAMEAHVDFDRDVLVWRRREADGIKEGHRPVAALRRVKIALQREGEYLDAPYTLAVTSYAFDGGWVDAHAPASDEAAMVAAFDRLHAAYAARYPEISWIDARTEAQKAALPSAAR
ncbi:MAG: hypothetical protein ACFB2Z_12955 [Maricaulaceae bacterium]